MYVLGISGLGQSEARMRRTFPGLEERHYRLAQGADAAAALVTEDGIVAAAAEERFARWKGTGRFPRQAIDFVLAEAGIKPRDVAYVAHNFDFTPYQRFFAAQGTADEYDEVYSPEVLKRELFAEHPRDTWDSALEVVPVAHHLAHAASAFYCSGFAEADVLVADGIGEFESTSLYRAGDGGIELLSQVKGLHSVGLAYGLITLHLGFWMNMDEYKVMGLAPYGDPAPLRDALAEIVQAHDDGQYATPFTYLNHTPQERATYARSLDHLAEVLGPARRPGSPIEQHHLDLAAALQESAQRTILGFLGAERESPRADVLCLAGGVALNCVLNKVIRESGLYRHQFVQPAAGDDGTALGAALAVLHRSDPGLPAHVGQRPAAKPRPRLGPPYLGPSYDNHEVEAALKGIDAQVRKLDADALATETARLLADGKVVALFQGRMEYGPRALGNRSILADPSTTEMRDRINSMVKLREEFRPLAPAVLEEHTRECFVVDDPADFLWMVETVDVHPHWRERLGGVTHVDGSARIQVVRRADNERYWRIIDEFRRLTGTPVVLNTSFNVRGEPIVCSPADAVRTFLDSDVDALVLEDHLIVR
ncbi:carbamoyltransferase C-terminal domain-containing protein [Actinosynnema sp. NPDC047251]|uniref:Carbamoyltransferase n=1 Tax=Saccharothrix espanaensis (strain ATCC 51144 / DSM 44229 / JCM 9112 / NBRC 15066 / NRRL 15764) TaxID=1179773 RepID=K0JUF9_SACES|nr:carbamoyltransferase C-terminal domain-containing protein [Saccharothrix espanaensis]CCH29561.1 Carbamoyltransferase [Saccharothrix espanaensis DSM 44229]